MTLFICPEGHIIRRGCSKMARALESGKQSCPVCSGKKALAGYNSLANVHPFLAAQWDPTRNAGLRPGEGVPGSNKLVQWICPRGHRYSATIANRALNGPDCGVCGKFSVLPGSNDFATTHPALAAGWHRPSTEALSQHTSLADRTANAHGYARRATRAGRPFRSGRAAKDATYVPGDMYRTG